MAKKKDLVQISSVEKVTVAQERFFNYKAFIKNVLVGLLFVSLSGFLLYRFLHQTSVESQLRNNEQPTWKNELTEAIASSNFPKKYIVKQNDTLWSVAQVHYGSSYAWVEIAKANNLISPYKLEINQELILPEITNNQNNPSISAPVTTLRIEGNTYTVLSNDSLWTIALRAYGDPYRWTEIAKSNNLHQPSIIHVGNVLSIPR